LNHHNKIFAAISKRNATAARNSMQAHLEAMASVLLEQDPSPELIEAGGNPGSGYNT
jgi:DNA-binding FadR family transcriptional regulator